jgi:hypothetical protein
MRDHFALRACFWQPENGFFHVDTGFLRDTPDPGAQDKYEVCFGTGSSHLVDCFLPQLVVSLAYRDAECVNPETHSFLRGCNCLTVCIG